MELKIQCPQGRAGSTPGAGIDYKGVLLLFLFYFFLFYDIINR